MGKGSEESEESQWTPTFCIMKCIITNVKMGRKGRKDRREEWAGGERAGGRENVLGWDALYCIVLYLRRTGLTVDDMIGI